MSDSVRERSDRLLRALSGAIATCEMYAEGVRSDVKGEVKLQPSFPARLLQNLNL